MRRFTFSDGVCLVLGLAVTLPFAANPNEDLVTRALLLAAGLVTTGLSWGIVRSQRPVFKMLAVPVATFLVVVGVAIVWKLVK